MRLPFIRRSRVEAEIAQLRDMYTDYGNEAAAHQSRGEDMLDSMNSYIRGKRDAYRRALSVMERVL